jgi:hypothetical protein
MAVASTRFAYNYVATLVERGPFLPQFFSRDLYQFFGNIALSFSVFSIDCNTRGVRP